VSLPSLPYETGYSVLTELIVAGHDVFSEFPHVRATFDTIVETNCCTGHVTALHVIDAITNENVETGQNSHTLLPLNSLNLPMSHAEHDCALVPPNPALHKQLEAPVAEFEFNGQFEQIPFPEAALNFPAIHNWH
jgi:hypothetical protein